MLCWLWSWKKGLRREKEISNIPYDQASTSSRTQKMLIGLSKLGHSRRRAKLKECLSDHGRLQRIAGRFCGLLAKGEAKV